MEEDFTRKMHLLASSQHLRLLWIRTLFIYLAVSSAGAHPIFDPAPALESPHFPPIPSVPVQIAEAVEGAEMPFECKIPRQLNPYLLRKKTTWFFNGKQIFDDRIKYKINAKRFDVLLLEATMEDIGEFACRIPTTTGEFFWSNHSLNVITEEEFDRVHVAKSGYEFVDRIDQTTFHDIPPGPPQFAFKNTTSSSPLVTRVHRVFHVGTTLRLPCLAVGNPSPIITWRKDNKPTGDWSSGRQEKEGSFNFHLVQLRDTGNYTCMARNKHGNVTYNYDLVIVPAPDSNPPRIESDYPKNFTGYLGYQAVFECKIISYTHPHVEWGRYPEVNGSKVYDEDGFAKNEKLSSWDRRYNLSDPTQLIIRNVTYNDTGTYYCIVKNSYGMDQGKGYLTVQPKPFPEPPRTNTVTYLVTLVVVVFVVGLLVSVHRFLDVRHGKEIDMKQVKVAKRYRITRKESELSDGSLLPNFITEVDMVAVGCYGSNNSGSIVQSSATTTSHCNSIIEYVDLDSKFEIPRECLLFDPTAPPLGEGAFGKVFKAKAMHLRGREGSTTVAVKTPKVDDFDSEQIDNVVNLLREMDIMGKMCHENVIKLYGCCTQPSGQPLFIIMEYAEHGNLKDFLRANRTNVGYLKPVGVVSLSSHDLLRFSYQIASGVKYLNDKKVLHRDLAARNILVAENYVMKVADFGLSKNVEGHDYYKKQTNQGRLPVKWMAPETMSEEKEYRYSTESDVWSFGIVMWEILTFGAAPYRTMTRAPEIIEFLMEGRRLDKPKDCPDEIYQIMRDCWELHPSDRPKFGEIVHRLGEQLQLTADYLALGSQPNIYIVNNQEYMENP